MQSLWIAKTGLDAQQTRMSVVSNNLANVNTTGFKRGRAVFEDLLYQNLQQAGSSTSQNTQDPTGLTLGTGVRVVATEKQFTQGGRVDTGDSTDLMIEGRGFFQILLPDGNLAFTRDGSFNIDSTGRMVTSSGYELQPAIIVPDGVTALRVSRDGQVEANIAGQAQPSVLGSI
ncbi:MAG: flagellar hook-basal body complex protein, partial [Gammaproteobacteria bacterium]|nr:flagellar hook-basal body complex protein [Gammaproteobacteria bacterium]